MGINKFLFLLSVAVSGVLLAGNTYYVDAEVQHLRVLCI